MTITPERLSLALFARLTDEQLSAVVDVLDVIADETTRLVSRPEPPAEVDA